MDVLDHEGPDFVTESIRVEVALHSWLATALHTSLSRRFMTHLEGHACLHLVIQHFRDALIEGAHNLHGKLRLDAAGADEVVESVRESNADPVEVRLVGTGA